MTKKQLTCEERLQEDWERVKKHLDGIIARIEDEEDEAYQELMEYGLSLDYVGAGVFNDQKEEFYRWLFSWGGPQRELRFFRNKTEYWLLDWSDGACLDVTNDPTARFMRYQAEQLLDFNWDQEQADNAEHEGEAIDEAIQEQIELIIVFKDDIVDELEDCISLLQDREIKAARNSFDCVTGLVEAIEIGLDKIEQIIEEE